MIAKLAFALLVLAPAALGAHPAQLEERRANLDDDRQLETVWFWQNSSVNHETSNVGVAIGDRCAGRLRRYTVARETGTAAGRIGALEIVNADAATRRREVFAWIGGVRPGSGIVKVVRLDRRRAAVCPRLSTLLGYSAAASPEPLSGLTLVALTASIADYSPAYRGREVQIVEQWRSLGDLPARTERRLEYGYDAARGRYVRYGTTLIPRGPA